MLNDIGRTYEVGIKRFFWVKPTIEKAKPTDSKLTKTNDDISKAKNEKEKAKMNITLQYELKVVDEESKEDSQITPLHEKSQNSNTLTEKDDSNSKLESVKIKEVDDPTNTLKRKRDMMTNPEEKPASLKKVKLTVDDPGQNKLSLKRVSLDRALKLAYPSPQK